MKKVTKDASNPFSVLKQLKIHRRTEFLARIYKNVNKGLLIFHSLEIGLRACIITYMIDTISVYF